MGTNYHCTARLAAALITGALAAPVAAAGVPAGVVIENTASATYTSNSVTQTIDSNTVSLRVDEVLDVAVVSLESGSVPVATTGTLRFNVTNTGNGPEAFVLTADPAMAGNDYNVTVSGLAIDVNGNGVFDSGIDTTLANGATTPLIAADDSLNLLVLVSIPAAAAPNATSKVQLDAVATTGSGAPGTVIAGVGAGGGDAVVGSSTASTSAQATLTVNKTIVSLVKSATITDPFGGNRPVPTAVITYSITANVTGTGTATGLGITDLIPAGTTYQTGTLTAEGAPLSDATDGDAGRASATGIAVQLGDVAAGATRTVTFRVRIN